MLKPVIVRPARGNAGSAGAWSLEAGGSWTSADSAQVCVWVSGPSRPAIAGAKRKYEKKLDSQSCHVAPSSRLALPGRGLRPGATGPHICHVSGSCHGVGRCWLLRARRHADK